MACCYFSEEVNIAQIQLSPTDLQLIKLDETSVVFSNRILGSCSYAKYEEIYCDFLGN